MGGSSSGSSSSSVPEDVQSLAYAELKKLEELTGGNWADVAPRPGAFVINTGEMLQELTGNYVVAATHRVITGEPDMPPIVSAE